MLLCLNELSCRSEIDIREVDEGMTVFVDLLRQCKRWREDVALVTWIPMSKLELSPGYPIAKWADNGRNRDQWRFIRAMQNRAPFNSVLSEQTADDVEYHIEGVRADGVGTAHLVDGLAVSLPVGYRWDETWLRAERSILAEDDEGDTEVRNDDVDVRHASKPEHLVEHENWARASGIAALRTGTALWGAREDYFPHIRFLPRVEEDLQKLRPGWLIPVRDRLLEMEAALSRWHSTHSPSPCWHSKESGEGETRRRLCRFTDLDGLEREFAEHLRFTPGHGRLHFRLAREDGVAVVAYIGPKILG